eukprot:scaffold41534_cov70-Phaeocystis_antarctica.AAC.3
MHAVLAATHLGQQLPRHDGRVIKGAPPLLQPRREGPASLLRRGRQRHERRRRDQNERRRPPTLVRGDARPAQRDGARAAAGASKAHDGETDSVVGKRGGARCVHHVFAAKRSRWQQDPKRRGAGRLGRWVERRVARVEQVVVDPQPSVCNGRRKGQRRVESQLEAEFASGRRRQRAREQRRERPVSTSRR